MGDLEYRPETIIQNALSGKHKLRYKEQNEKALHKTKITKVNNRYNVERDYLKRKWQRSFQNNKKHEAIRHRI